MDLNETAVFAKVVEAGSFAGAAGRLGLPKSTVSAKVAALEKRLGATLIRRTTRRLFVTDAGQEYYRQAVAALDRLAAAEERVAEGQAQPRGRLRLTAPIELGVTLLPLVLPEFQKRFPEVQLDVSLSDRRADLVAEGFDLALRAGVLADSSLIARKVGSVHFAPLASARYLRTAGTPKHPRELEGHRLLHFVPFGGEAWDLKGPKGAQKVRLTRPLLANDLNLIKSLAIAGAGIALLPTFYCHQELAAGRLVRLLEGWRSDLRPVHFVYPHQDFVPKKLSAFLEVATEPIRRSLDDDAR